MPTSIACNVMTWHLRAGSEFGQCTQDSRSSCKADSAHAKVQAGCLYMTEHKAATFNADAGRVLLYSIGPDERLPHLPCDLRPEMEHRRIWELDAVPY